MVISSVLATQGIPHLMPIPSIKNTLLTWIHARWNTTALPLYSIFSVHLIPLWQPWEGLQWPFAVRLPSIQTQSPCLVTAPTSPLGDEVFSCMYSWRNCQPLSPIKNVGQANLIFSSRTSGTKERQKNGRICGGNLSISLVPTTHAPSSIPGSLNFLSPDHFLFFWYPELSDILSIKSYFIPLHENLVSVPYNQKPYKRLGGCKKMWTKWKLRQEKQYLHFEESKINWPALPRKGPCCLPLRSRITSAGLGIMPRWTSHEPSGKKTPALQLRKDCSVLPGNSIARSPGSIRLKQGVQIQIPMSARTVTWKGQAEVTRREHHSV